MAQLRTQLDKQAVRSGKREGAAGARPGGKGLSTPTGQAASSPVDLVRELRAAGVTDERVLVTTLVEGLLLREFGERMSNDAEFHQTVAMVVAAMADDPEAWALCKTCLEQAGDASL
jgi:hypothetical protein